MNRIEDKFRELKTKGKKAFVAFITAGDPDISTTKSLILKFEDLGVDIVELGVPFSDPLADGPTIQKASVRALKNGIHLHSVLELVSQVREKINLPIVLLSYYNPIFRYGEKMFVKDACGCGVDGVIIPDLPPEEGENLIHLAREWNLATILLLAPTSTPERIKLISRSCSGFIYYVSVTGVTGAREKLPSKIRQDVKLIKSVTDRAVCVGFGISSCLQAARIAQFCDGIIVGSAIIKRIEENLGNRRDLLSCVGRFIRELREAV